MDTIVVSERPKRREERETYRTGRWICWMLISQSYGKGFLELRGQVKRMEGSGSDGRRTFSSLSVALLAFMCLWMWTLWMLVACGRAWSDEERLGRATILVASLEDDIERRRDGREEELGGLDLYL